MLNPNTDFDKNMEVWGGIYIYIFSRFFLCKISIFLTGVVPKVKWLRNDCKVILMFTTCTLHKIQVPTKMGEIFSPFQHTLAHCVTSVQLKWLLIQTLNERKNVVTDCCCIWYIIFYKLMIQVSYLVGKE